MSTTPDYGEPWDFDGENWITDMANKEVLNLDSIHSKNADRLVACVNACAGMADPAAEIQAMREAIKNAFPAFSDLWNLCPDVPPWALDNADAALAKLKPFIRP